MAEPHRMYLVECYAPGIDREAVESAGARARDTAASIRGEGRAIEYLGALFVADDEVIFHAFRAADRATVEDAGRRAAIAFERVVESVDIGADAPGATWSSLTGSPVPGAKGSVRS